MEVILARIDGAVLSFVTNEPQRNEVERVKFDASEATPGPQFQVRALLADGWETFLFNQGDVVDQFIPPARRSAFTLVLQTKPDGIGTGLHLQSPEWSFMRLR